MERSSPPTGIEYNMATGTVKWFNATKGFGFIHQMAAARTFSSTYPQLSGPELATFEKVKKSAPSLRTIARAGRNRREISSKSKADRSRHTKAPSSFETGP